MIKFNYCEINEENKVVGYVILQITMLIYVITLKLFFSSLHVNNNLQKFVSLFTNLIFYHFISLKYNDIIPYQ